MAVRGANRFAVYLEAADGALLALVGPGANWLPCAVRMVSPDAAGVLDAVAAHGRVVVGLGRIQQPSGSVEVRRWWEPIPVVPRPTDAALEAAAAALRGSIDGAPRGSADVPELAVAIRALRDALAGGDAALARQAADGLLGGGPGSTPSGDDVLAGLLVTMALVARVHSRASACQATAGLPLARYVVRLARSRTTPLSAALLEHAAVGRPCGELATLVVAMCGRGDVAQAVQRLLKVGHTSGCDLAEGALLAVDTALGLGRAAAGDRRTVA